MYLTNSSRGIQHAWHYWYALVFVLKCNAVAWSLRASPLNWALVANEGKYSLNRIFRVKIGVFWWGFVLQF
ncbi:hybrid peroxiredoxin hyPrx5 domain protein [Vibrio parahaemolyticus]|nr:hybrid peroxiredoxin hyPrx5 domain protein [Vibrio parahaemolyticus]